MPCIVVEHYTSPMSRIWTTLLAALIVFGGWTLLKIKVFTPAAERKSTTVSPISNRKVLWTSNGSELPASGDDPRAVFSIGLSRYLSQQVSSASAMPLDRIDPAIVSQTDDSAHMTATIQGIHYHGKLKWAENGWQLVELSREN